MSTIKLPTTQSEAEAMISAGKMWLDQHCPHTRINRRHAEALVSNALDQAYREGQEAERALRQPLWLITEKRAKGLDIRMG